MAFQCPTIVHHFHDETGAPLEGGQLFSYEAGTANEKITYQDQAASVPNSNPIVLDARGETPSGLFLTTGDYKFVLKDAESATIWTRDDITGVNDV